MTLLLKNPVAHYSSLPRSVVSDHVPTCPDPHLLQEHKERSKKIAKLQAVCTEHYTAKYSCKEILPCMMQELFAAEVTTHTRRGSVIHSSSHFLPSPIDSRNSFENKPSSQETVEPPPNRRFKQRGFFICEPPHPCLIDENNPLLSRSFVTCPRTRSRLNGSQNETPNPRAFVRWRNVNEELYPFRSRRLLLGATRHSIYTIHNVAGLEAQIIDPCSIEAALVPWLRQCATNNDCLGSPAKGLLHTSRHLLQQPRWLSCRARGLRFLWSIGKG